MTSRPRDDASAQTSGHLARDARAFVRLGGHEAVSFFEAADEEEAAEALLRFSARPSSRQPETSLRSRGQECSGALPAQGIPGYAASVRAAAWLQRFYFVCILLAAGWAVVSFFAGDPDRDPLLLPPEVVFVPTEEILLLAPIALVGVYVPTHLAVLWKVRTSTRAVLRWASDDRWSRTRGIPAQSPFLQIMASWESLKAGAYLVLMMDGFLTVFLYFARQHDESYGLFLTPVVCALPILATYLVSSARARLAQRRHLLVADRLFRVPADEEPTLPYSMVVEGLEHLPEGEDDSASTRGAGEVEDLEETAGGDTEWRSGFSAGAPSTDHLVDPERRKR